MNKRRFGLTIVRGNGTIKVVRVVRFPKILIE